MISPHNQWGPFAEGIDPAEQRAGLRSLRALTKIYVGARAADARLAASARKACT